MVIKKAADPRESGAKKDTAAPAKQARTETTSPMGNSNASAILHGDAAAASSKRKRVPAEDKMVQVEVPKRFGLQHIPGQITWYEPGVQDMPLAHAEHPYAVANGVRIVE